MGAQIPLLEEMPLSVCGYRNQIADLFHTTHKVKTQKGVMGIVFFLLSVEVYYESIKREPKIRGINKCRCDERLQTKTKEFTRLPYTGLVLELEHLKQGLVSNAGHRGVVT